MKGDYFLPPDEQEIAARFLTDGYIVSDVECPDRLDRIRGRIALEAATYLESQLADTRHFLNFIHKNIPPEGLNEFRLQIIKKINELDWIRPSYFNLAREWLASVVGNELAMQLRLNLSIQLPGDNSSLLSVHADSWSGDSPFEVVLWVPLVDCYRTKSMYLLPPEPTNALHKRFGNYRGKSNLDLYQDIKKDVVWMDIPYGKFLLFNQNLPHGNCVNDENETRWSINCRFKSLFSPYGDKKLGEFFEPITLRPASTIGIQYDYPQAEE